MQGIGIIGAGVAGLHLGLFLQQHGIPTTIYTDKTPEQKLASRLPNTVAHAGPTRARERKLGVNHWDFPDFGVFGVHFESGGPLPLRFFGAFSPPGIFVDTRIYLARLMDDYTSRGGQIIINAVQTEEAIRLSRQHELIVVASGRASLAKLFPRIPEHSPYTRPQRLLCAGLFHGIRYPEPMGMTFALAPGHGEIFHAPFYSFDGPTSSLLFEGIPGQGFDALFHMRYEDDPKKYEAVVLDLLREHAPTIFERVDPAEFGLTRPLDLLHNVITPTVRRGYAALGTGRCAIAIGDAHVVNDPSTGQGANAASHAAFVLGEAIVAALRENRPFDEQFCSQVEQRIWEYARAVTEWTNATLQPPPPHLVEILVAASQSQTIADAFINLFTDPPQIWRTLATPQGAHAFLRRFQAAGPEVVTPQRLVTAS